MTKQDGNVLWNPWIDLWNGDLAVAEEIIHPEFALHRIPHPRIPDKAGPCRVQEARKREDGPGLVYRPSAESAAIRNAAAMKARLCFGMTALFLNRWIFAVSVSLSSATLI